MRDLQADLEELISRGNYKTDYHTQLEWLERAIKAEEQVVKLQLTLQEIANPIKFLKQWADEQGTELNGLLALNLATDAGYIKGIAKKALAEQEV